MRTSGNQLEEIDESGLLDLAGFEPCTQIAKSRAISRIQIDVRAIRPSGIKLTLIVDIGPEADHQISAPTGRGA